VAIVEAEHLYKRFGETRALDGITCEIPEGATGLLGPNGAGKTTLLRVLLGLLPATGRGLVLGLDPRRDPLQVRARIGYMPESECMLPGLAGIDVVAFLGRLAGLPRRAAFKRAHEVTNFVGLGEERYRDATEYSAGMLQRLKLATALVHDPDLLFLDEPTNGLDPRGREAMLDLIRELAHEHGKHVLLSSHLLPDVEHVCDTVVMLREGRVARCGSIRELTSEAFGVYEVLARGDRERFFAALRTQGAKPEERDGAILVRLPLGTGTEGIFSAARSAGAQVRGLRPLRRTLEHVFLDAVEGKGGADAG